MYPQSSRSGCRSQAAARGCLALNRQEWFDAGAFSEKRTRDLEKLELRRRLRAS